MTLFCEYIPLLKSNDLCFCFQMIMDLNTMGLICDNPQVKGREYEEFMRKYRILTTDELKAALRVDASDIFNVLNQSIPCVGCRRRYSIITFKFPTLAFLQHIDTFLWVTVKLKYKYMFNDSLISYYSCCWLLHTLYLVIIDNSKCHRVANQIKFFIGHVINASCLVDNKMILHCTCLISSLKNSDNWPILRKVYF